MLVAVDLLLFSSGATLLGSEALFVILLRLDGSSVFAGGSTFAVVAA